MIVKPSPVRSVKVLNLVATIIYLEPRSHPVGGMKALIIGTLCAIAVFADDDLDQLVKRQVAYYTGNRPLVFYRGIF